MNNEQKAQRLEDLAAEMEHAENGAADREEAMREYRGQRRIREEYLEDERDTYGTETED